MQNSMDLQERRYFLLRAAEYELSISGRRPESMQAKRMRNRDVRGKEYAILLGKKAFYHFYEFCARFSTPSVLIGKPLLSCWQYVFRHSVSFFFFSKKKFFFSVCNFVRSSKLYC